MIRDRKLKVFMGPVEVAGTYSNLCKGFRALGVDCDLILYAPHPFGYDVPTRQPWLIRISHWIVRHLPRRAFWLLPLRVSMRLTQVALRSLWGLSAIPRYNVFIFSFGQSLLPFNLDLPLLRLLGKRVISNLSHGSDARPPVINGAVRLPPQEQDALRFLARLQRKKRRRVAWHEAFASVIIGAPLSAQFMRKPFVNRLALGRAIAEAERSGTGSAENPSATNETSPVRIVHAPSNPEAKGTPRIIEVIERLRATGYEIDFRLLHGKSNREVLEEIACCDLVIDQIYSDLPLSGFGAEATSLGKPVIVAGYAFDKLRALVPAEMWPPVTACHPDELERTVEWLVTDPEARHRLGAETKRYVRERSAAQQVAERFLRLVDGDIPNDWWLDPQQIIFVEGGSARLRKPESL